MAVVVAGYQPAAVDEYLGQRLVALGSAGIAKHLDRNS